MLGFAEIFFGCSEVVNYGYREHPLVMSDFRGDGGSEMTPKKRTLVGKNWTLGQGLLDLDGRNCQKYLHQTKADF